MNWICRRFVRCLVVLLVVRFEWSAVRCAVQWRERVSVSLTILQFCLVYGNGDEIDLVGSLSESWLIELRDKLLLIAN